MQDAPTSGVPASDLPRPCGGLLVGPQVSPAASFILVLQPSERKKGGRLLPRLLTSVRTLGFLSLQSLSPRNPAAYPLKLCTSGGQSLYSILFLFL